MDAGITVCAPILESNSTTTSNRTDPITIVADTETSSMATTPAWGQGSPSPWGKVSTPTPCGLEQVMSEELAKELQEEEELKTHNDSDADIDFSPFLRRGDQDTSNDLLLAQMMQHEFDREHDKQLQAEEDKCNGTSKVKMSFKNYRSIHPALEEDGEEMEEYLGVEEQEESEDPVPKFKKGISGKGKNIVTKHDSNICGKKNASKLFDQFPPEFETGDIKGSSMQLPNRVFNHLKKHTQEEKKRSMRLHERKEHSTVEQVVDAKTRLILFKLVNGGVLESINGHVSAGKESTVFHAKGGVMSDQLVPAECAVKVFKTTLSEFKNRGQYVRGDMRFFKEHFKRQNPRKIIKVWADKELQNLKRMEHCGIPCPRAIVLKKHVLIMSFIGENQRDAPKLKDAGLSPTDMQLAYEQCIQNMTKMYQKCRIVHADLSEYNMLWHAGTLYFIDVAQAVESQHPLAMEFLLRDCSNVVKFFSSHGVPDVPSQYQLFNQITDLDLKGEGKNFLMQIQEYEKNEDRIRMDKGKEYPFEFFFNKAKQDREEKQKMEQPTEGKQGEEPMTMEQPSEEEGGWELLEWKDEQKEEEEDEDQDGDSDSEPEELTLECIEADERLQLEKPLRKKGSSSTKAGSTRPGILKDAGRSPKKKDS